MIYEPFAVVIVPFPFVDKRQEKRRPALVISSREHQKKTLHVTLLMITSAKNGGWPSDYLIHQLTTTTLTSPSIIRQKLFTIDSRLVIKAIGRLSTKDKSGVLKNLRTHIHLELVQNLL